MVRRNFYHCACRAVASSLLALMLGGCFAVPLDQRYKGPPERPETIDRYYSHEQSYSSFTDVEIAQKELFTVRKIEIQNQYAPIEIQYFKRPEKSDNLILVFPVLGGSNVIADYFARYFARGGYDTAIVVRNNEFKDPANVDRLEEILRQGVVRDRVALDFFEKEYGKKNFGSFGISRGGINVAMTAGVDPRLKYNVIVLGGSDLVGVFKNTKQRRIRKYRNEVMKAKNISSQQFYDYLAEMIKTDPKFLSKYMDARDTLLILSLFDNTVPIHYGYALRHDIGKPRTIFLLADHYTGLLYTQFLRFLPPTREFTLFPFDYVEGEALQFYQKKMPGRSCARFHPLKILRAPLDLIGRVWFALTHGS